MARTSEFVLHFVRCDMATKPDYFYFDCIFAVVVVIVSLWLLLFREAVGVVCRSR